MNYQVKNIVWDTNGQDVALPGALAVEAGSADAVAEALSARFGYLVSSLDVEAVESEPLSPLRGVALGAVGLPVDGEWVDTVLDMARSLNDPHGPLVAMGVTELTRPLSELRRVLAGSGVSGHLTLCELGEPIPGETTIRVTSATLAVEVSGETVRIPLSRLRTLQLALRLEAADDLADDLDHEIICPQRMERARKLRARLLFHDTHEVRGGSGIWQASPRGCSCPDFRPQRPCKHVLAVRMCTN